MIFTNDDLKHFHEEANAIDDDLARPWIAASKLKSLLARLEAAENIIEYLKTDAVLRSSCNFNHYLALWRKAAGK